MKGFELIAALTDEFRRKRTHEAEIVFRDAETKKKFRDVKVRTLRNSATAELTTIVEVSS